VSAAGRRRIGRSPTGRSVRTDSTSAPAHHRDVPARGSVRVRCVTSHRTTGRPRHGARTVRWGFTAGPAALTPAPDWRRPGSPTPWPRTALTPAAGVTSRSAACGSCSSDALAAVPDRTPAAWRPTTVCSPRWPTPATARAPSTGTRFPRGPENDSSLPGALRVGGWPALRVGEIPLRPRQSSMTLGRTRSNRSTRTGWVARRVVQDWGHSRGSNVRRHRVAGGAGYGFPTSTGAGIARETVVRKGKEKQWPRVTTGIA